MAAHGQRPRAVGARLPAILVREPIGTNDLWLVVGKARSRWLDVICVDGSGNERTPPFDTKGTQPLHAFIVFKVNDLSSTVSVQLAKGPLTTPLVAVPTGVRLWLVPPVDGGVQLDAQGAFFAPFAEAARKRAGLCGQARAEAQVGLLTRVCD